MNLALIILTSARLVFNLVLEGPHDEEEVGAEQPPGQPNDGDPREDAADVVSGQDAEDEVKDVQYEDGSSQHDPRFQEVGVPLKYKDILIRAINRGFKHDQDITRSLVFHL